LPSSVGSRTDARLPRGPTSRPDFRFCHFTFAIVLIVFRRGFGVDIPNSLYWFW
jgi:hypothetical protein